MKKAFKIIENKNGQFRFIYHGINGDKNIEKNKWLKAIEKITRDGSSYDYLSGFHFFETETIAQKYFKKFKNKKNKIIVPVEVKKIRKKGPNTEVKLASFIKFV